MSRLDRTTKKRFEGWIHRSFDCRWQRKFIRRPAGCTATAPMTLVMENVLSQLPAEERYPIYPVLITARVAEETGAETVKRADVLPSAALLAHFGYGAVAGAAFGLVHSLLPLPTGVRGAAFGLAFSRRVISAGCRP